MLNSLLSAIDTVRARSFIASYFQRERGGETICAPKQSSLSIGARRRLQVFTQTMAQSYARISLKDRPTRRPLKTNKQTIIIIKHVSHCTFPIAFVSISSLITKVKRE